MTAIRNRILAFLLEIQYFLEFLLVWPIVAFVRRCSEDRARRLAIGLARVAYRVLPRERLWALRNLQLVYGDALCPAQRTRLAMRSFEQFLFTRAESLRWSRQWMLDHVIVVGEDLARQTAREARARGVGVIIITGHIGNFELIPPRIYEAGFGGPVVYRPQNNWRVERLLLGSRAQYLSGHMLPRTGIGILSLMHSLREGHGVGLIIDQNTLAGPTFVEFLGFMAASPPGAAALALATGAPVILAVAIRQNDGKHRLIFHRPFPLIDTGHRKQDIAANTQQYMHTLEKYVLAYPEQYNWLHPRWRFRPDGTFWTLDMPLVRLQRERVRSLAELQAR